MEINVQKDRIINELIELIKIISPSKRERAISNVLKKKLNHLGLEVIEDCSQKITNYTSGNLVCNLYGDQTIPPILFTAHMDTIDVNKEIKPQIKDNYIMSDGTTILGADNKVGIAVMLEAIKLLKQYDIKHGHIQFVFTVGEESGLVGAKAINRQLLRAKYGYALDHTGKIGDIVTKGINHAKMTINIQVSLNNVINISAIKIATKAIKRIRLGKIDEDTTVHIVNFAGLNESNLIHDSVKIIIEIKSFNKSKFNEEINTIKQTIKDLEIEFDMTSKIETELLCNGFSFNDNDEVVQIAKKAAKSLNLSSNNITTKHSSDANVFTSYGIPTANLAVGYENIHTHLEKYNLNYLVQLTQLVISIIQQTSNSSLN